MNKTTTNLIDNGIYKLNPRKSSLVNRDGDNGIYKLESQPIESPVSLTDNGIYRLNPKKSSLVNRDRDNGIYKLKSQNKVTYQRCNKTEEISEGIRDLNNTDSNKLIGEFFTKSLSFLLFPLIIVVLNSISSNYERTIEQNRVNACVEFGRNNGLTTLDAKKKCNYVN